MVFLWGKSMNITLNSDRWSDVKIDTNINGDTVITLVKKAGDEAKRLAKEIDNPNSEISKSLRRAFDINRRR